MFKKTTLAIYILLSLCIHGAAQEINVLSYNIRYASFDSIPRNWDLRKEGVFTLLKGHDFIGLQEVVPLQMLEISTTLDKEYAVIFRTRETDTAVGEGSPVLYNKTRWDVMRSGYFWLSDTPEIHGSNTWGAAYNRIVTYGFFSNRISGDSILVINTHFDHISQHARKKSIELIITKFAKIIKEMPVVLMGDLNVTPENRVYKKIISGTTLTDSYLRVNPGESVNGATFHGWTPVPPVKRIDYIFISEFLEVQQSEVLHDMYRDNYPSDHFPVKSILNFKKQKE